MQSTHVARSVAMSRDELDAKLAMLQQLCLRELDEAHAPENPSSPRPSYLDVDTDSWIDAEYKWALDEARESSASDASLFTAEEDMDECMPNLYDPTLSSLPRAQTPAMTRQFSTDSNNKVSTSSFAFRWSRFSMRRCRSNLWPFLDGVRFR